MDPTLTQILTALYASQAEVARLTERLRWVEQERNELKRSREAST